MERERGGVGHGENNTYDLLVVAELEVVLHDELVVPGKRVEIMRAVSLARANRGARAPRRYTHFLISYLSSWPFLTLPKSHATTYWPVEVTIAFSSLPSPMLNLRAVSNGET